MKRFLTLFVIMLMLTLPVAFAQELSVTRYSGEGVTNGYARTVDEVTIEALAQIPGESIISEDQVRLYVDNSFTFFDNCTPTGGGQGYHECTFYEPDFESYEHIDFTVELRDDDDNIVGSEPRRLVIDNTPPQLEFNVDPLITNGPVSISYMAEDFALTHGDTTECSGIKEVTFTADGVEVTDSVAAGTCLADNVIDVTLESGTTQVCGIVTDHVGLQGPPFCADVTVDSSPPQILSLSVLDYHDQAVELTHVRGGETRLATIQVAIDDDGEVDASKVTADLSQLNPAYPDPIPPDDVSGTVYTWQSVDVGQVSPCNVDVHAEDILGNVADETFLCDIKEDDQAPVVVGIQPENTRDNTPLYGFGTPLIISFEEKDNEGNPGVGMNSKNAYLDLSALGMSDFTAADDCIKTSGSTWECTWYLDPPIETDEGSYTVTLLQASADDLDNTISAAEQFTIIYDNTGPRPPEIVEFTVVSGEQGVEYEGGAIKGDYVQYKVRSRDFETMTANFTGIGGNTAASPTTCTDEEDSSTCTFEQLVSISGPYRADLSFTALDDAGNKATTETALQVYGLDNETNPAYWHIAGIECTPSTVGGNIPTVDRKLASIVSPYITCAVDLDTPRDDITTLAISGPESPDACTGDIALNVADVYATNTAENSKEPMLVYTLEAQEFFVDELNVSCPITILSKRSETVAGEEQFYVSPYTQELEVNTTIKFYNNPLGDLYERTDKQIIDEMNDGLSAQDWIGDIREVLQIGEQICQWKNIITSTIASIHAFVVVLGTTETALKSNPITAGAAPAVYSAKVTTCNLEEASAEGYKDILNIFDFLCSIANCSAVGGKDSGIESYLGGGVPWCSDAKQLLNEDLDLGLSGGMTEAGIGVSVKESIVLSTMCLCLPGILYNLDKLRQTSCFKAVCMNDYVKERGYPVSFCNQMQGYMQCEYVVGQVFALLPFTQFFDKLISIVVDMITNPVALFTVPIGAFCNQTCYSEGSWEFVACSTVKLAATVGEAWGSFQKMEEAGGLFEPVGTSYCDRMEEIRDEMEGDVSE